MINRKRSILLLYFTVYFLWINHTYAFTHEISIGYGAGREIEQNHINRGVVLSGKLYKFTKIDNTLIASIDGTLASINSSTKHHNHLVTAAIVLAMRAYFVDPDVYIIRPYIQASFGPSYLSVKQLGNRKQGANFAFQTSLQAGTEFSFNKQNWDINISMFHYCNAGIFHPNEGINLVPVISIGYIF